MNPAEVLSKPLKLNNGSVIPNRFAKSAMSETLGTIDSRVTQQLVTLYCTWAEGGTGLSITGNVMVDRRYIGEPQNVVLEDERDIELLSDWAEAGRCAADGYRGVRTGEGMAPAVASGATDLVGLARPLAIEPDLPNRILSGESLTSVVKPIKTGIRMVDNMALMEVLGVMTTRGVRTRLRAGE